MNVTTPSKPQAPNDVGSSEASICAILSVPPDPVKSAMLGKECRAVVRLLAHAFKLRLGCDSSACAPSAFGHSGFGLIAWNLPDRGRGLHVMRETLRETGYLDHAVLAWRDSAEGIWRVAHSPLPAETLPHLDGVIDAVIREDGARQHAIRTLLVEMGFDVPEDDGSTEGSESGK